MHERATDPHVRKAWSDACMMRTSWPSASVTHQLLPLKRKLAISLSHIALTTLAKLKYNEHKNLRIADKFASLVHLVGCLLVGHICPFLCYVGFQELGIRFLGTLMALGLHPYTVVQSKHFLGIHGLDILTRYALRALPVSQLPFQS